MRSFRLPEGPYHSTLTKIGGPPVATRLSRTSGVRPTAWAMDGKAALFSSQRARMTTDSIAKERAMGSGRGWAVSDARGSARPVDGHRWLTHEDASKALR